MSLLFVLILILAGVLLFGGLIQVMLDNDGFSWFMVTFCAVTLILTIYNFRSFFPENPTCFPTI